MPEGITHSKVYRPWGNYLSLIENKTWQVKLIEVKPGEELSLQMHHYRSEHWVVVKGIAKVEKESKVEFLKEKKHIHTIRFKHRLSNPEKKNYH